MFLFGIDHLTSGKALQIARGQLAGTINEEARNKIDACHKDVLAIANSDKTVYGINTGFGPLCDTKINKEDTTELQRKLLISHSVGVGNFIAPEISKLMMILKVHALAQGYSGISIQVIERIQLFINENIIPAVPEKGSVGASGDLAPLSHLFLPLIGEGQVYFKNQLMPSSEVLGQLNLSPLELHPKASLALINGTQFIAAHCVLLVEKLHRCLSHADIIGAMMIDGLKASSSPFRKELHEIRPFKGNIFVANRLRKLLTGSEILESHSDCERVQDPYSLRCMPQVHGSSRDAWLHLKEKVEIEINSVTDNPIILSNQESISGGNFHGQPLALVADYACLAAAEIGNISDRRTYLSIDGKYKDVPKLLLKDTGLNSGFMIVQYAGAALVSENKSLCFPASADSIPTSLGQEDHVSMGSISARKALQVCENLEKILAIEMICAAQAIDFHRPLKSSDFLEEVHKEVRSHISFATEDRIFAIDIEKALTLLQSNILEEKINTLNDEINYSQLFSDF